MRKIMIVLSAIMTIRKFRGGEDLLSNYANIIFVANFPFYCVSFS